MTRDQARKIAEAIFDDIERERLFSLDRVADVIERTARMEADRQEQEQQKAVADHLRQFEHKPKVPTYYPTPDEDLAREVERIYARKRGRRASLVMDTAPGRTAMMEQTTLTLPGPEVDKFAAALDNPPEPSKGLIQLFEAHGPFGGTINATSPELAKKASQLLDFCKTPSQTIIQPDD